MDIGFNRDTFINFCLNLSIPAKDGYCKLRPKATQLYLIDEIIEGLERGVHHFTILKCGQAMCTTICLAFDLFWLMRHKGVVGSFVADDNQKRSIFNVLVRQFHRSLVNEADPEFYVPILQANDEHISFENESMLVFNHANQRAKGMLGRGVGTALVHGTECAFWTDEEGWKSLLARISSKNPDRLYLFESTANGSNFYKKKWEIAKRSSDQKAIFIGWWLHPDYSLPPEDPAYKTYWETNPHLDKEETRWVRVIKEHYNFQVNSRHMAWWRKTLEETYTGDRERMYQENPPYDALAFQFTGDSFISKRTLNWRTSDAETPPRAPRHFTFRFGHEFMDTRLVEVDEHSPWIDLTMWEEPKFGKGVMYAIGADPAHGANEEGCYATVEIFRCYADRLEQVAEFRSKELPPYQLAWVILYLYGAYHSEAMYGVETQGGGAEVYQEIDRVRAKIGDNCPADIVRHFRGLQTYMYSRPDAARKSFNSRHFKMTETQRDTLMAVVKTYTEKPITILHSPALVEELSELVRKKGEGGKVTSDTDDDLVFAYGFALQIYTDHLIYKIGPSKYKYDFEEFVRDREKGDETYTMGDYIQDRLLQWKDRYIPGRINGQSGSSGV